MISVLTWASRILCLHRETCLEWSPDIARQLTIDDAIVDSTAPGGHFHLVCIQCGRQLDVVEIAL